MAKKDFNVERDVIVAKILEQMEQGIIPWHKPWFGMSRTYNYKNGRPYNFLNEIMLGEPGAYVTKAQLFNLGGKMKDGHTWKECCRQVVGVFSKRRKQKDEDGNTVLDENGEPKQKTFRYLKYYYVVNVKYTTLPEKKRKTHLPPAKNRTAEKIMDAYLEASGVRMANEAGNRAFYSPLQDAVTVPKMSQFREQSEYYSTCFHELGHSTGHPKRLGRFEIGADHFGSEGYAKEELVAEFTAAILNNYTGIGNEKSEKNSAAYLQNWAQAIKDDPHMFTYAAFKADAAASLIIGREKKDVVEPSEVA